MLSTSVFFYFTVSPHPLTNYSSWSVQYILHGMHGYGVLHIHVQNTIIEMRILLHNNNRMTVAVAV